MDSELYKDLYKFEWDQRTHLTSAVNIPIVAITALGTVTVTMAIGYGYTNSVAAWTFSGFLLVSAVALAAALVLVITSLLSSEYQKIPSPIRLRNHFEALCAWHLRNGSTREAAQKEFSEAFNLHLARAAEENGKRNRLRGNYVFLASAALSVALIPMSVAGALYVAAHIGALEEVHNVRLVK